MEGNLLLDIEISGVKNNSDAFYLAREGDFNGLSSRMVNGAVQNFAGYGLITTFSSSPPTVPQPSTLALLGLGGIGLVIGACRRTTLAA